jgi:maltose alpha-D-glucosyltransferase/alpha-amylase
LAKHGEVPAVPVPVERLLDLTEQPPPPLALEVIGSYLDSARLLGQRTAQMHQVLASEALDPQFAPEAFSALYQRSLYQSMRSLTGTVFRTLHRQKNHLPDSVRADAHALADRYGDIIRHFRPLIERRIQAPLIRIHGDYHLGQVLYTGKDFLIIDFEGEPIHSLAERRRKRSPLRDVAGMIRSFSYAAHAALQEQPSDRNGSRGSIRPEDRATLAPWLQFWYAWVSASFLRAYLGIAREAGLLPPTAAELAILLDVFMLQKAVYELGYELQHRPDWVMVPIRGIQQLLRSGKPQEAVHL